MIGEIPRGVIEDDKGNVTIAPERYASYSEVRDDCNAMIDADRPRSALRAHVDKVLNGNRPIQQSRLDKKGFSWMPNINNNSFEGYVSTMQAPLFDLVTQVDHCVEVYLDIKGTRNEIEAKQDSIQRNFTWLMFNRWRRSFNSHITVQQREMLVHGVGVHVWPDKNNWMCRTLRSGRVLFPQEASTDFNQDGERFMIREFIPAHTAIAWIKNEKVAASLGYNRKAILKTLARTAKDTKRGNESPEELLRQIRRGDYGYSATSKQSGFWMNWLFCNELDTNKISQYGIAENFDAGDYLFKKRNRFDSWPLSLFTLDGGDGTIAGIRGYGIRTVYFFELLNRVNNAMAAQVLISMFPQIKQMRDDVDPDKLKLMRMGALSILPYGVEPTLIQYPPLNNGPLALVKEMRATHEQNTQTFNTSTPEPKDRETAYSFSMRAQDSARVNNGVQSRYESDLQHFYEKTLRALVDTPDGTLPHQEMAKEFRDRCKKDGVTADDLKHIEEVNEITSAGSGSPAARHAGLEILMQYVYPNVTPDRQITILRDVTSNAMGPNVTDRYVQRVGETYSPTNDDSMATVESNGLSQGGDATISAGQEHVPHATNHLAKAEALKQACESGQEDPAKCLTGLMKLLDHAGQHLAELQNNPTRKAEFDQLSQQWDDIAKFTQQLKGEVEAQANQPDPQQQLSEDGQIKMAQVQLKDRVDNKKADAGIARQFRKQAFTERLADQKTAHSIDLNNVTARAAATNGARPAAKAA